jgi:hypothetical protein
MGSAKRALMARLRSRRSRWLALAGCATVAGVAVAVVLLTQAATEPPPPAAAMPLAGGEQIIAQRVGGVLLHVTDAPAPYRYRYLVIAGTVDEKGTALMTAEVKNMLRHGWTVVQSLEERGDRVGPIRVPYSAPGAGVLIDGPHDRIYASMDIDGSVSDANIGDLTPFFDPQIKRALKNNRPVLNVTLGNDHR